MPLAQSVISALSWRAEACAGRLSLENGQRLRHGCGRLMGLMRAHSHLPEITQRAAILCFHGVIAHRPDPDVERDPLTVQQYRHFMRILQRSFRVISLTELVEAIRTGHSPPPRSVVVTFDDGYETNHSVVAPVMSAMKLPWSTFLPAGLIEAGDRQWIDDLYILVHRGRRESLSLEWEDGRHEYDLSTRARRHAAVFAIREACRYVPEAVRRQRIDAVFAAYSADELDSLRARYPGFAPMSWAQARELLADGVDVGSHGLSHIALGPQPEEQIRHELQAARDLLQMHLGEHSPHFSYPYGRPASITPTTERLIREMGYHCALTLEQEIVRCEQVNLLQLPRLIVSAQMGRVLLALWQRFAR